MKGLVSLLSNLSFLSGQSSNDFIYFSITLHLVEEQSYHVSISSMKPLPAVDPVIADYYDSGREEKVNERIHHSHFPHFSAENVGKTYLFVNTNISFRAVDEVTPGNLLCQVDIFKIEMVCFLKSLHANIVSKVGSHLRE